jgi:DnaK suppressor protein
MASTHPLPEETPASYQPAEGEDYMSSIQLAHFRQLLLDWKQSLLNEVDRTVNHMRDESTAFPDPNDRATQEEEFSLELRTRDRERKLLKKINESLAQIDNGDYGYCEACGMEIGLPRMQARPTATLCIDCKMLEEVREGSR